MNIIAAIEEPSVIVRIITHLGSHMRRPSLIQAGLLLTETGSITVPMLTLGLRSRNDQAEIGDLRRMNDSTKPPMAASFHLTHEWLDYPPAQ